MWFLVFCIIKVVGGCVQLTEFDKFLHCLTWKRLFFFKVPFFCRVLLKQFFRFFSILWSTVSYLLLNWLLLWSAECRKERNVKFLSMITLLMWNFEISQDQRTAACCSGLIPWRISIKSCEKAFHPLKKSKSKGLMLVAATGTLSISSGRADPPTSAKENECWSGLTEATCRQLVQLERVNSR